jgi:hypothetical protein
MRHTLRKRSLVGALAATAVAGALALPAAAGATTEPQLIIAVRITVSQTKMLIEPNILTRGTIARVLVVNASKLPRRVSLGGRTSALVQPGKQDVFFLQFAVRGRYTGTVAGAPALDAVVRVV